MSEFARILGHKGMARPAIAKLSLEQTEWLIEMCQEHKEELKHIQAEEMKMEGARQQALQQAREALAAVGLDFEVKDMPQYKQKRIKAQGSRASYHVPDKYQVMDLHGNVRNWSGFGHPPVQMKQAYAEGFGKEDLRREKHATLKVPFTDLKGTERIEPEKQQELLKEEKPKQDKKHKDHA